MSLVNVKAMFSCDGCGSQFYVGMDPAVRLTPDHSAVMDLAEQAMGGDGFCGYVNHNVQEDHKRGRRLGTMATLQHGHHLCPSCTHRVDHAEHIPESRNVTAEELRVILNSDEDSI